MGLNAVEALNISQLCLSLQRPPVLFSSHSLFVVHAHDSAFLICNIINLLSCGRMYMPLTQVYMFLTLLLMRGSILSLDFTVEHVLNTAKRYCSYTFNEDKSIYLDRRVCTCDSYLGSVCHCNLKKAYFAKCICVALISISLCYILTDS